MGSSCANRIRGNASVTFSNNKAENGGAMHIAVSSIFIVSGNCFLMFRNNPAYESGGGVYMSNDVCQGCLITVSLRFVYSAGYFRFTPSEDLKEPGEELHEVYKNQ